MTRFALSANSTAVTQPHVPYVLFVEMDFASGFVRVNSGDRYFTHEGNQYGPLGQLGSIGPVKENGNLSPEKLEFQLSGVDSSYLTTTLTEDYHGRDVRLWVGYLDTDLVLVATPQLIWEGYMDTMQIHTDANESIITVIAENRLIRWNQSADFLYTHEHQRLFDSTDDFFNQVAVIANKVVKWGEHTARNYNPNDPRNMPSGGLPI